MPQKSAPKSTRAKKSSSSKSMKVTEPKSNRPSALVPFLVVCIIFAAFIGYYIADQRAIIEIHGILAKCQQALR